MRTEGTSPLPKPDAASPPSVEGGGASTDGEGPEPCANGAGSSGERLYHRLAAMFQELDDTVLNSIRVELYFHLLSAARQRARWPWKGLAYSSWAGLRAWKAARRMTTLERRDAPLPGEVLFVVENETAAGLGTLLPLVDSDEIPVATILVTDRVALGGRERGTMGGRRRWFRLGEADGTKRAAGVDCGRLERLQDALARHGLWDECIPLWPILRVLVERAESIDDVLRGYLASGRSIVCAVTHNDFMPATRLAGRRARQFGIRECTLQHGMPALEYAPIDSERYLVWGDHATEWLADRGASPSALTSVGCPRFDSLFRDSGSNAPDATRRVLMIVSQTHSRVSETRDHERFVLAVGKAAEALGPEWCVMVRMHPLESRDLYDRVLGKRGVSRLTFCATGGLAPMLKAATVVAGALSTAMIEAMIARRPVVGFECPGIATGSFVSGVPGTTFGAGEELALAASRLTRDSEHLRRVMDRQREKLNAYFAFPGGATDAALRHILDRG